MREAHEEEKRLAIEAGDVINDIPFITVVIDGGWAKQSYGKQYDSLSGWVVVRGARTEKVLFLAVMNKYCFRCDKAARKDPFNDPEPHTCYRNFARKKSSGQMESYAAVEAFVNSLKNYGVIYKQFVGDNDSSVY